MRLMSATRMVTLSNGNKLPPKVQLLLALELPTLHVFTTVNATFLVDRMMITIS
jgi:hypothetical protein